MKSYSALRSAKSQAYPRNARAARHYLAFHLAVRRLQGGAHPDDVGAGLGQRNGHGLADAPPASGHEGGFTIQFKLLEYAHASVLRTPHGNSHDRSAHLRLSHGVGRRCHARDVRVARGPGSAPATRASFHASHRPSLADRIPPTSTSCCFAASRETGCSCHRGTDSAEWLGWYSSLA